MTNRGLNGSRSWFSFRGASQSNHSSNFEEEYQVEAASSAEQDKILLGIQQCLQELREVEAENKEAMGKLLCSINSMEQKVMQDDSLQCSRDHSLIGTLSRKYSLKKIMTFIFFAAYIILTTVIFYVIFKDQKKHGSIASYHYQKVCVKEGNKELEKSIEKLMANRQLLHERIGNLTIRSSSGNVDMSAVKLKCDDEYAKFQEIMTQYTRDHAQWIEGKWIETKPFEKMNIRHNHRKK